MPVDGLGRSQIDSQVVSSEFCPTLEERTIMKKTVAAAMGLRTSAMKILAAESKASESDIKKIQNGIKIVVAARKNFENVHSEIFSQIDSLKKTKDEIDETIKGLEKELKGEFKEFDKMNGITEAGKASARTLASLMSLGESADALLEGLEDSEKSMIRASESQQPSYKSAFELLCTLLNGTEYEVYGKLIMDGFKKIIVEFEKASYQVNIEAKDFPEEYKQKYKERQDALNARRPDAPLKDLKASSWDSIVASLASWIKSKFSKIAYALKSATMKLLGIPDQSKEIASYFNKITKVCNKI